VVRIGDYTVARVVEPPGFRWSTHIQPVVGGEWWGLQGQRRLFAFVATG
jgi:hypothetical protein